ncbi:hypothetical protein SteCoe_28107 [Stentor coeruleus]|uniref:Uncharacterized protein n=1 Tax=Stentor coeruleus TaxID=5963 RepID=A0A1R2B8W9_9CILI|nr:hypothetical protein SteCoe_28107 [Stentor coeruleus]
MGCCQISLIESEFQSSPAGSMILPDKPGILNKSLPILIPTINDPSFPPPKLTPYFGRKFNFEDADKGTHDSKPLEIS